MCGHFLVFIILLLFKREREKEQSWVGKEDLGGTGGGENMIKLYYCMEIFLRSFKKLELSVKKDVIETVGRFHREAFQKSRGCNEKEG